MSGIIIAAVVVSCTGLLLGLFLGVMGKKFYVEVDQKEIDVRAELPGNNCGGCGYAGCDALAKAIAAGEADCGACPVGGAPVAAKIAAIMGEEAGESNCSQCGYIWNRKLLDVCDRHGRCHLHRGV